MMKSFYQRMLCAVLGLGAVSPLTSVMAEPTFVNALAVPGNSLDRSGLPTAFEQRLSFGSDLFYDRSSNTYYGIADRGPGGGVIGFETRVHQFALNVNSTTGAVSNYQTLGTTLFRNASGQTLNGLNPSLLGGSSAVLGNSFDPEGLVRASNGNYFIADEYGPAVREFNANGQQIRVFTTPSNLISRDTNGVNLVDGRPTIVTGRQDNRGFEGLTMSPDGTKLYAVLQAPLVNEGSSNDGRRSNNVRIVEFSVATGRSTRQIIYQTEALADINNRIPGTSNDFTATQIGRSIGLSAIRALPDGRFLVLERDNRGVGVDNLLTALPVGSKRVFIVDPSGATDVSDISLANTNALPNGVVPVSKELYLDIVAALTIAGVPIAEKIEGIDFGPELTDGSFALLLVSDNDFSVTQNGAGTQFNVCYDVTGVAPVSTSTPLSQDCAAGTSLIPSYIYAFKANSLNPIATVPTPTTSMLVLSLLGLIGIRNLRSGRKAQDEILKTKAF
jgi:Esterase-like activity of phytase